VRHKGVWVVLLVYRAALVVRYNVLQRGAVWCSVLQPKFAWDPLVVSWRNCMGCCFCDTIQGFWNIMQVPTDALCSAEIPLDFVSVGRGMWPRLDKNSVMQHTFYFNRQQGLCSPRRSFFWHLPLIFPWQAWGISRSHADSLIDTYKTGSVPFEYKGIAPLSCGQRLVKSASFQVDDCFIQGKYFYGDSNTPHILILHILSFPTR